VIVGIIWRKPVLTHASIVCGGMPASVNSVNVPSFSRPAFWEKVCKTVRPMLSDHCLSVCPVCNVGLLWSNGSVDQDETWYGGRPRLRQHCYIGTQLPQKRRLKEALPLQKREGHSIPHFSAHVGPGHIVLDGDPAPPKGHSPPLFSANVYCGQTVANLSYC